MNGKRENYEALIAKYKVAAAAARSNRDKPEVAAKAPLAVQPKDGLITVRFGNDAKPLSSLGGVAKVVGHSRIDIPDYKLHRG